NARIQAAVRVVPNEPEHRRERIAGRSGEHYPAVLLYRYGVGSVVRAKKVGRNFSGRPESGIQGAVRVVPDHREVVVSRSCTGLPRYHDLAILLNGNCAPLIAGAKEISHDLAAAAKIWIQVRGRGGRIVRQGSDRVTQWHNQHEEQREHKYRALRVFTWKDVMGLRPASEV